MSLPFRDLDAANARLKELCEQHGVRYSPQVHLTRTNHAIAAFEAGKIVWAGTMLVHNTAMNLEGATQL